MMINYTCIITNAGAAMIARAAESGVKLNLSKMAVGDGIQNPPDASATQLIGEQYRAPLNTLKIAEDNAAVIVAEMVMPASVGGFWTREVGLFADDGTLVAVGNLPASYKPETAEGSGRVQTVRMSLIVSSTQNIQLVVDPAVVMATVQYVDKAVAVALNAAADAMEEARQKVTFDEMYPIGDTKFFARVLDPNKKWPGTLWYPIEENKTIRLARADGSDVMETGGRDSITIARVNLPPEEINVSGNTNQHDTGPLSTDDYHFGTKRTAPAGAHTARGRYTESNTSLDGGNSDRRSWSVDYGYKEEGLIESTPDHEHTMDLEDHRHQIPAIKHGHTVTAKTEQLGQGVEINMVNSYIKIYGWYRAA
jgi:hypothetical protein